MGTYHELDIYSDMVYMFWIFLSWSSQVAGSSREKLLHPTLEPSPSQLTFNRGETAILTCTVQNLGTKTVTWRKLPFITPITAGEKLFAQDPRFQAVHIPWKDQWNLGIKNVQMQDAGTYECQVGTREHELRQNITLSVIDKIFERKPEIKISGTRFPERGGSIFLLCNATGRKYPPDNIEWYKNGERLHTDSFHKLYIKEHVAQNAGVLTSSLEIKSAKPEDNGTYICRAVSNSDGSMMTRLNVNVLSAGSNYAKRGTLNHTTKPDSEHNDAIVIKLSYRYLCSILIIQTISQILNFL